MKAVFITDCARLRINNPAGDALWHLLMGRKTRVSLAAFTSAVDVSTWLSDGETLRQQMADDEAQHAEPRLYHTHGSFFPDSPDDDIWFYQAAGFEFFFQQEAT